MNKNVVTLVGIFLVGIIAYQAYLLGKLEAEQKNAVAAKKEPKITVEIEKEQLPQPKIAHTNRSIPTGSNTTQTPLIDEKKIKEDFNRLFKDIFGNPKVKAEIQKNVTQMQQQLQEGLNQFQKEIVMMTSELQKASEEDPLLKELFQNFKLPNALEFTDTGKGYSLEIDVPNNEKSTVDVKVRKGFLVILINEVVTEEHEENGVMVKKELKHKKQVLVTIPEDADTAKLETKYDNGKLRLILPKKVAS